jgi:putative ABC transport system ATP-binding protein
MMREVVYNLQEVTKKRSKGGVSFTLNIPELTVHRGEFIAVVGPSGCGKSTLLDLLALVLEPSGFTSFSINTDLRGNHDHFQLNDLSENDASRIRGSAIGYVLQNGGLLPFLTVRENIMLTPKISKIKVKPAQLDDLVARLGLTDQLNKKPQYLSGGQRQRVAVARALIHRPAIVLADEPTAAVDYPTALDIRDELKELAHKADAAVLMVTHDKSLVQGISDAEVQFDVQRVSMEETVATTEVKRQKVAHPISAPNQ